MTRPVFPLRTLFLTTAALTAPTVLALLVLVALAGLPPGWALLTGAAVSLLLLLLLRPHFADLAALRFYVEERARGQAVATPTMHQAGGGDELAAALRWLDRSWAARDREFRGLAAAQISILNSLPDPLLLLDVENKILQANDSACQLFGDKVRNKDLAGVIRAPAVLEAVAAAREGEGGRMVEYAMRMPVERVFSVRVAPLPHTAIAGAAILVSFHDITQIKRSERMRADFVANASHELRTPLTSFAGYVETLRGPAREDEAAREKFLGIMESQAHRMIRLVDDLMSLSHIELQEHAPPQGRVELASVLRRVAETARTSAEARQMSIRIFGDDGIEAKGDPDQLTQVFQNLIDNAVKYGGAGTPIEVTVQDAGTMAAAVPEPSGPLGDGAGKAASAAKAPDAHATIGSIPAEETMIAVSVQDHGEGIPPDHLSRLTERFYRVDTARSRALGGTGLGLAIVKHIVARHRGQLKITSTIGKGSRFTVLLPRAKGGAVSTSPALPQAIPAAGQGPNPPGAPAPRQEVKD